MTDQSPPAERICSNCGKGNPTAALFCMKCGRELALACPSCATSLPLEARFCFHCGYSLPDKGGGPAPQSSGSPLSRLQQYIPKELLAKLEASRDRRAESGAMEGERRVVTMLFCDVTGSTAMAEQLDPEEWAEVMNGAFEHLLAPVYRYEGTLARLMGDAILAFFGAPIAHEDDPQRAVLAGLGILEGIRAYRERVLRERGLDFDVRVGINTGLVVVGEIGSDLRVEYTAMGDAVNIAARMEQTALPGTVRISHDTYRLVSKVFEFESLGEIEVKGRAAPVTAYRALLALPGAIQPRGVEGLRSPLVGRARELDLLHSRVQELLAGRGQIVSLIGEAGLGKSRLVAELRQGLVERGLLGPHTERAGHLDLPTPAGTLRWLEGRSLSYETTTPYAPFVDLLSALFSLQPGTQENEAYAALQRQVGEIAPERRSDLAPFLATLLGIQSGGDDFDRVRYLEPPQLRGRVFAALRELVERLAAAEPLILVFEDLHWIDPTSLEVLELLLPITDRAPLMILALIRPQRQEPSWRFHETAERDYSHRYSAAMLESLDEKDSRALVANLLHIEDLPEKVRALILKKAEGNPFFVEEVIRSLLDGGLVVRHNGHWRATREIENISVPNTLAGVITARLDRLDEQAKRLVQTASVIGREFAVEVLAQVHTASPALETSLTELQRRELIREKSRTPQWIFLFKHVLTQETAYASVLLSRRRELHQRVAESLERTDPNRVHEIARHFLEAKEDQLALPFLIEAGNRAARAYATAEATGYYRRALQILDKVGHAECSRCVFEGLAGALTLSNDVPGAMETYQRMIAVGQGLDDLPMQVSALNKLALVVGQYLGQLEEADRRLVEAEQLAQRAGDMDGLAELYTIRCSFCNQSGNFEGAVHYLEQSVHVGESMNKKEQRAYGLTHIAMTLTFMTRFDESWEKAQEAIQVAEEISDQFHLAEVNSFPVPMFHLRNGDFPRARAAAQRAAEISVKIGAAFSEFFASWMLGELARLQGDYDGALRFYEGARAAGVASGVSFIEVMALGSLGTTYAEISLGLREQATEHQTRALEMLDDPAAIPGGGVAWAEIGVCAMMLGDLERARSCFQKGLTTPTPSMLLQRPRYYLGQALLALAEGDLEQAEQNLHQARGLVEGLAMRDMLPSIEWAYGRVLSAKADWDSALGYFLKAEQLAAELQLRPLLWQAQLGAAQAYAATGRMVEAEEKRSLAQAVVEEIAAMFQEPDHRRLFLAHMLEKAS